MEIPTYFIAVSGKQTVGVCGFAVGIFFPETLLVIVVYTVWKLPVRVPRKIQIPKR
jgi:hypothetical protein